MRIARGNATNPVVALSVSGMSEWHTHFRITAVPGINDGNIVVDDKTLETKVKTCA